MSEFNREVNAYSVVGQQYAHSPDVLGEIRNHVAVITLNRPAALNALSFEMVNALHATLRECERDDDVYAVMIKGAGEKAFCAGGDVRALHESVTTGGTLHERFFIAEYQLDHYLHRYPKPYVALMDGITMGGGMGIAQGSKLRIVTDRTRIAMPEVGIGLFPDVGGSYFLSRLPGALGVYLALTGNTIRAADALYAQLGDVYWSRGAVEQLEGVLGQLGWTDDPRADLDRAIRGLASQDYPAAPLASVRHWVDLHFGHDTVPDIMRSLRGAQVGDPAQSEWAEQTLKTLESRSPTLLAVALRQLQRGKTLSLADCFRMELCMVRRCFGHGDFVEGVRALLIDKDCKPRWRPARWEEVTPEWVDGFFQDPWSAHLHPLAHLED